MAWGRIDDTFDDHPKVLALLDGDDQAAAAIAIGLWTLCLTWAHRNTRKRGQTPGLLPAGLPRRFINGLGRHAAELLVKHKLWDPQDDGGWLIHDFDKYLPTDETREARSEAGKRGAEKRWGSKGQAAANGDVATGKQPDGKLPSTSHDGGSNGVANDGSRAPAHRAIPNGIAPTPIPEPEPEDPQKLASLASSGRATRETTTKRATRIPADFGISVEMRAWAAGEIPGFDVDREHKRFRDYWRGKSGKDATKTHWVATWRNWMRRANDDHQPHTGARASPVNRSHEPYRNPSDADAYSGDL